MSTLTVADPPKFAEYHSYTCCRCEHEELGHPVFLSNGGVYGSGCAAILLGRTAESVSRERDHRAATVQQQASVDAERIARYAAALADYRSKGSAIVREDPTQCDFNALRVEYVRRDPSLRPPAAFAEWLESRIAARRAVA
jgi:hypothetical protein